MSGQARQIRLRSRRDVTILALVLSMSGGCSALAGEAGEKPGFWTSVLEKLDVKAKPATMPEFVRATRPDANHLTFMPTGPVPRQQAVPVKSVEEIEAAKTALDAAQAAQLRPRAPAGKKAKPATAVPKTP